MGWVEMLNSLLKELEQAPRGRGDAPGAQGADERHDVPRRANEHDRRRQQRGVPGELRDAHRVRRDRVVLPEKRGRREGECRDDEHRFLPWTAAVLKDESIAVDSPIVMLEEEQLAFYRTRAKSLRELVAVLENVLVDPDGTLEVVSDDAA